MPLTRDFKKTLLERAKNDSSFRDGLLDEAINEFFEGNVQAGKELMNDYIKATEEEK